MSTPLIELFFMPYSIMLILKHASGVLYRNQTCGVACLMQEVEGVLAPVEMLDNANIERIMNLPWVPIRGISTTMADELDSILASITTTQFLTVDRERLSDSTEAWVHVVADTREDKLPPRGDEYGGEAFDFGRCKGVLTWPNSD